MTDAAPFIEQIIQLHQFFEDWFVGRLPKTDAAFKLFPQALDESFELISPSGKTLNRQEILGLVYQGHQHQSEDFAISIKHPRLLWQHESFALLAYEEWQQSGDKPAQGRQSTALLEKHHDAIRWRHVHETALASHCGQ